MAELGYGRMFDLRNRLTTHTVEHERKPRCQCICFHTPQSLVLA